MKNKNIQTYSNECGKYAIKNLLSFYNVYENIDICITKEGSSINDVEEALMKYFNEVKSIYVDLRELYKIKNFIPIIVLIKGDMGLHYVVIYKASRKHVYVLDSSLRYSCKIKISEFDKYYQGISIIPYDIKSCYLRCRKTNALLLVAISVIETISSLLMTIFMQGLVDNASTNSILYIAAAIIMLLSVKIKVKHFFKDYESIDKTFVIPNLERIYNLSDEYCKKHRINEIYYRFFDVYNYKTLHLSFYYNLISDIITFTFSFVLLFIYIKYYAFIYFAFIVPLLIIMLKVSANVCDLLEDKRVDEFEFFAFYKDSFVNDSIRKGDRKEAVKRLQKYQKSALNLERIENTKNYLLMLANYLLNAIIIICYLSFLKQYISAGYLIAIISIVSSMNSPIIDLATEITSYSNIGLIKQRIEDLK